jgi:hypothetical protein
MVVRKASDDQKWSSKDTRTNSMLKVRVKMRPTALEKKLRRGASSLGTWEEVVLKMKVDPR